MCRTPIVILGAGPTGLGAACALQESDCNDWIVFEGAAGVGGLSRSFVDDHGFTWDIGGHVVFSHYERFTRLLDELLPPDAWLHHERESWVRVLGRWVPYPFQNNIHRLPEEACQRCLDGLVKAAAGRTDKSCANFEEFIRRTLGEGIAEIFMVPYNRKVWAFEPAKLSATWVGDRVSLPDAERAARNVERKTDDVGWGPNNRFRFPLRGGTGAIWNAVTDRLPTGRIIRNSEAVEIDPQAKVVTFADGRREQYGTLISTMPLDRLVAMLHRKDWEDVASGLLHSAINVVGVGLKDAPSDPIKPKCWMYFPENTSPFHRVTHFSHYSPHNVDDIRVHWSLMAEVSESPEKPVDRAQLISDTVKGMTVTGLIEGPEQVHHTWCHREEYGYPIPALGRDAIVQELLPKLSEMDILSRGRFGAWLYEVGNMDHSFMQGVEAVGHLLHGSPELTVWNPHLVNQPHPVLGWNRFR
jgi:protoporphyrinogen oxidase